MNKYSKIKEELNAVVVIFSMGLLNLIIIITCVIIIFFLALLMGNVIRIFS